jgi:signal transduction histidine kinase
MQMKLKFKLQQKLALSFLVIFALFTAGIVILEQGRARRAKADILRERLDAYAGQVMQNAPRPVDSLLNYMPPELRVTLVERGGRVVFDNTLSPEVLDNHASRPEIAQALSRGVGSDVRRSASTDISYLYYARAGAGDTIVRVAMPYDSSVRPFLKADNAYLYLVVALFLLGLYFIYYIGRLFGRAVGQAREREKNRRLKREMTGNIAHELRTPVTSIRGFLEILLENKLDGAKAREYLERAYNQTRNLSELIADMGMLSRIESAPDSFRRERVELLPLVRRVADDLAIEIETHIPQHLAATGNENLLYSIFRNLADNAVKYAGRDVRITVSATVDGDMVRVSFSDNGPGVDDERHLGRLFERFYRVGEGRTRDTGGSGLGLSIVKNAVQLHGGHIEARNNHGLEFIFTLPV